MNSKQKRTKQKSLLANWRWYLSLIGLGVGLIIAGDIFGVVWVRRLQLLLIILAGGYFFLDLLRLRRWRQRMDRNDLEDEDESQ